VTSTKKYLIYTLLITITLLFLIESSKLLYQEFRLANIYGHEAALRDNLISYKARSLQEKIFNYASLNKQDGLDVVSLYIPEKVISALESKLPDNIKKWQKAKYVYPDGTINSIKVKFKGDNPLNWGYGKKSWRVKTKKNKLLSGSRYLNYVIIQDINLLNVYLSHYIAQLMGVATVDFRLVELVVNGKSQGVYLELSQPDESYLRKNKIMPVNLYKGEQYHTERTIDQGKNMFVNSSLWRKKSVFNQRKNKDYLDLTSLFNLTKESSTSSEAYESFKRVANIEAWARYSALITMIHSGHNDIYHNMRLISDVWKGGVLPMVHDTGANFSVSVNHGISPHNILKRYSSSSEFLLIKYKYIYMATKNKVLIKASKHVDEIRNKLANTWDRDLFHTQFERTNWLDDGEGSLHEMKKKWNELSNDLIHRHEYFEKILEDLPDVTWYSENNSLSIVLNGKIPVGNMVLTIYEDMPTKIAFDKDGDGKLSSNDLYIPFEVKNNKVYLNIALLANNTIVRRKFNEDNLNVGNAVSIPTLFSIISDVKLDIDSMEISNMLTGHSFNVNKQLRTGSSPSILNYPVSTKEKKEEIWSGKIEFSGVTIINNPIIIKPGTQLIMHEGASVIFSEKINAVGMENNPIIVRGNKKDTKWGTFALNGTATSDSKIIYLKMSNGSGYISSNSVYSSMFAIHDTENILVENSSFSDNYDFDDMIHIVYGKNIVLKNVDIFNSYADAVDIDISTAKLVNLMIDKAGNDGVDAMTSEVYISGTCIKSSGDKGVSIGERSNVAIFNSDIQNNVVGVASKDDSISILSNTIVNNNKTQFSAYKKNWRYSNGGVHNIYNSTIVDGNKTFELGKKSSINVYSGTIVNDKSKLEDINFYDRELVYNDVLESTYLKKVSSNFSSNFSDYHCP